MSIEIRESGHLYIFKWCLMSSMVLTLISQQPFPHEPILYHRRSKEENIVWGVTGPGRAISMQ